MFKTLKCVSLSSESVMVFPRIRKTRRHTFYLSRTGSVQGGLQRRAIFCSAFNSPVHSVRDFYRSHHIRRDADVAWAYNNWFVVYPENIHGNRLVGSEIFLARRSRANGEHASCFISIRTLYIVRSVAT